MEIERKLQQKEMELKEKEERLRRQQELMRYDTQGSTVGGLTIIKKSSKKEDLQNGLKETNIKKY